MSKGGEAQMNSQSMTDALNNAMLRETIEKLEDQKVKLLLNIKNLVDKLTQQKQDQSDIYYYLNKKLDDNYEVIAALEDQILAEQGDRETAEKAFERRIDDLDRDHYRETNVFTAKILDLEEKLQILKQFSAEKEDLDENLRVLLDTLENERKQYRNHTEEIERKAALDREKVKHEYELQIQQYKADIQKKVDAKLSKAVKNTRTVNDLMQNELKFQSNTVQNMLKLTDNIIDVDKTLRVELSIAQSNEDEIVHRLATYQRIIKQLNARIAQEEESQALLKSSYDNIIAGKDEVIVNSKKEIHDLHAFIDRENKQLDDVWKALSETFAAVQLKKKLMNRPVNDPSDHNEVLCEVFYRILKKNPLKFRGVMKTINKYSNMDCGASTAGSEGGMSMSVNSSKDSLMFPKINNTSVSVSAEGSSRNRKSHRGARSVPGSIDLSSDAPPKPYPFKSVNRYTGKLAQSKDVISDSDSEFDASPRSMQTKDSSSIVTGIPSWDKGHGAKSTGVGSMSGSVVTGATAGHNDAHWWLNQDSIESDSALGLSITDPMQPGGLGQESTLSAVSGLYPGFPGFAEDSMSIVSNSNTVGLGLNVTILNSLCEVKLGPESRSYSPTEHKRTHKHTRVQCKDAAIQTEGRVSVFPVNSVWNQSSTAARLGEITGASVGMTASSMSGSSSSRIDNDSLNYRTMRAMNQSTSSSQSVQPITSDTISSTINDQDESISPTVELNQPTQSQSPGKPSKKYNHTHSNNMRSFPQKPLHAPYALENSPIKVMMQRIPVYEPTGNSKESLIVRKEQNRRVLHGRKIIPASNSKEIIYHRAGPAPVTLPVHVAAVTGPIAIPAPVALTKKQGQGVYSTNTTANSNSSNSYTPSPVGQGLLAMSDDEFSLCGSSIASTTAE